MQKSVVYEPGQAESDDKKIGKNALKNSGIKDNPYFIKTRKKPKTIDNNQMIITESYEDGGEKIGGLDNMGEGVVSKWKGACCLFEETGKSKKIYCEIWRFIWIPRG